MSGTVFSVAHSVVRKDKNSGQLHQRREPDRGARVIAEDEEGRAEGPKFGQREAVHNGGHRVLANTQMQVLTAGTLSLEISRPSKGQRGLVRWSKICRTAEEP